MSKRSWTDQQLSAITTKYVSSGKSCNLLVSAAAGSGKTAVLVERIIRKLLPEDSKNAVDADRLLVVTFTNAAAREMAERINVALAKELQLAGDAGDRARKKQIKRQQLLLSVSDITTIDAFCLKFLRKYFNLIGLEPDFSIADESQAQLLSEEAMDELFEELYDAEDTEFINLLCLYATSRSDEPLASLIRHIYKFTRSIPYPDKWLAEKVNELSCPDGIANTQWFRQGIADTKELITSALSLAENTLSYMCETGDAETFIRNNPPEKGVPIFDEWKSYYKAFYYDYVFLKEAALADASRLASLLADFSHTSLTALSSKSEEEKDHLKNIRQSIKAKTAAAKAFLSVPPSEMEVQSREKLYPIALSILHLVEKYDRLFMQKKLEKNLLEFHDAEQLTARLLSENPDVAREVMEKYDEVLMDEYQDTSSLQEEIFSYVTSGDNLFMVGDMKQSIYRFRSSDPTIFKNKSDRYKTEEDAPDRKIILSNNFRSRHEVLESINDIFEAIMTETAGELDYDADQRLYCGNKSFLNTESKYISECHIIEAPDSDSEDEDVSNPELEARFVASRINQLKAEHFKVSDGETLRDIENRDIVILMSSYKSSAEHYMAELQRAGIECFVESSGYFERNEIRTVLSLLKIISNPYCDIPLLAVMRSPIASFTDDELVVIRKYKKGRFLGAVKEIVCQYKDNAISNPEYAQIAQKAENFLCRLKIWRGYARFMPTDKLLWRLYEETDFYAFCGALYDGDEAQANLRLLFERAKQYESGGFEGLFNFIKYLERIEKKDTDLSSAKQSGEAHNVVRIMTIHKSKGLEFPVVFITGGNKRFNKSSDEGRVLLHKDLGIAMDYIDFENSYRAETPAKAVFKAKSNREQVSEEIRKLYVATTRAKEKLIFVATVPGTTDKAGKSKLSELMDKWNSYTTDQGAKIPPEDVLSASGFADWVCPVAISSPNWEFNTINHRDIGVTEAIGTDNAQTSDNVADIVQILEFNYPYADITDLPTKVSVSELKAARETVIRPMPEFLKDARTDGTFYGTSIHKVLQNLVPCENMDENYIKSAISTFVELGTMTSSEAELIAPGRILEFYNSPLGKRILSSDKVVREQPFEVGIPAKSVYPEIKNAEGEDILLQGVIDCFFIEDGGIVLVDYKTDRYKDTSEIYEKYHRQLELYEYALAKITNLPVKEKFIYLFSTGKILKC